MPFTFLPCQYCRQYIWDILESTVQKASASYHTSTKELADTKEKLNKVLSIDTVCSEST